ncbi:MAG TPA: DUF58 domain-containing protein [Verrucomicrobiae bacterium]|nr:DUF58 domain-containing protein [Verrucomicrobiae bacterium]
MVIVPRNGLLFWTAAVVLPFALLAALEPTALSVAAVAILGLALATFADAVAARRRLSGVNLAVAPLVRMSQDREARFEVRIQNPSQRARALRLALVLPREFQSRALETEVTLPEETEWSRLDWSCRPLKRGQYRLAGACVEMPSPFGFWHARKRVPLASELRVYPNLLSERKDLAALFLHRGAFGLHAQRQIGKGREFEKLREYVPGDGYDEIHWKATARRGRPITKVFQIERTQEVYVVIDASRLSARPMAPLRPANAAAFTAAAADDAPALTVPPTTTLERFLTAALVLGLAAEQQGDLFGVLTFTDKIGGFIRARNGKSHYSACRDALYTLEPQAVTPDYDEVFTFIRLRLRRRALLVILTALDDPVVAESFVKNIPLICRQHLVLVNMLPPPGVAPVFSDGNVGNVDGLYERLGGHLRWQQLRELGQVLKRRGVQFTLLKNERLSSQLVSQYINVKRRQVL